MRLPRSHGRVTPPGPITEPQIHFPFIFSNAPLFQRPPLCFLPSSPYPAMTVYPCVRPPRQPQPQRPIPHQRWVRRQLQFDHDMVEAQMQAPPVLLRQPAYYGGQAPWAIHVIPPMAPRPPPLDIAAAQAVNHPQPPPIQRNLHPDVAMLLRMALDD